MIEKICFGTASLGIKRYGVNPQRHDSSELEQLNFIFSKGVLNIDTAPSYGNAEKLIGQFLRLNELEKKIKISTKLSGIPDSGLNADKVVRISVTKSLQNLGVDSIELLYLHQNNPSIFCNKDVTDSLQRLKKNGFAKKIGVSVYSHDEFIRASSLGVYDVIQVPVNIFDTSFLHLEPLGKNIQIVARSVFLQGALFADNFVLKKLPDGDCLCELRKDIFDYASKFGISPTQLAISYLNLQKKINYIIVGSRSIKFWSQLLDFVVPIPDELIEYVGERSISGKPWTNPRLWNL